jgi:internalin A
MERFDLSYQIDPERPGSPTTRSLIPQLLPHQPPTNLPALLKIQTDDQIQLEMRYRFDFVPAGIMSWFIVRTHCYTQNLHWREGVALNYQNQQARVELNPRRREVRLVVWGVQPHNFFTILMSTMDLLLTRFEGIRVQRDVPCLCHRQRGTLEPCPGYYPFEYLVRCIDAGKHEVECRESLLSVSVPELLYGIHISTNEQIIRDIMQGQQRLLQGDLRKFL